MFCVGTHMLSTETAFLYIYVFRDWAKDINPPVSLNRWAMEKAAVH